MALMADPVRDEIDFTLRAAYAEGLISSGTFAHRLDELLGNRLVDRRRLIGDLSLRSARRRRPLTALLTRARGALGPALPPPDLVLTLDWTGETDELLVGRARECSVGLENLTVSRRHAALRFRDGIWIVHDLGSKNGSAVNGVPVVRSQIRRGDRLSFGTETVLVD